MPSIDILNLIQEQQLEITIHFIQDFKHGIEVFGSHLLEAFIIEVGIGKQLTILLQYIIAQSRFTASSDTDYYLRHITVQFHQLLLRTGA